MSCKCQNCNQQYKVDIIIPDDLWKQIKPKDGYDDTGMLCGKCITQKLEDLNIYSAFELKRL